MKHSKQKTLFLLGAFCIVAGIIITKVTGNLNIIMIGLVMIAIGTLFISTNIIMRLINHSKMLKNKDDKHTK